MRAGPSCTERYEPTPWPVPWSKSTPACHRDGRASESSCAPVVPSGKRARAIAMWPFSTRVKRSRISPVGSPIAMVRVMSVVPSTYWAPELIRSSRRARPPVDRGSPGNARWRHSARCRRWSGTRCPSGRRSGAEMFQRLGGRDLVSPPDGASGRSRRGSARGRPRREDERCECRRAQSVLDRQEETEWNPCRVPASATRRDRREAHRPPWRCRTRWWCRPREAPSAPSSGASRLRDRGRSRDGRASEFDSLRLSMNRVGRPLAG